VSVLDGAGHCHKHPRRALEREWPTRQRLTQRLPLD